MMSESEKHICKLCGEPMPAGEEMFYYHAYSGDCPKPPLPREPEPSIDDLRKQIADLQSQLATEREKNAQWIERCKSFRARDAEKAEDALETALLEERAKRGALIEQFIDGVEETMGHNRTNLSEHDGCIACLIIERLRAIDPDATTAWDAIKAEGDAKIAAATKEMADAAEMLWVVLANVSEGNWEKQNAEWQNAAARYRDNYFDAMKKSADASRALAKRERLWRLDEMDKLLAITQEDIPQAEKVAKVALRRAELSRKP